MLFAHMQRVNEIIIINFQNSQPKSAPNSLTKTTKTVATKPPLKNVVKKTKNDTKKTSSKPKLVVQKLKKPTMTKATSKIADKKMKLALNKLKPTEITEDSDSGEQTLGETSFLQRMNSRVKREVVSGTFIVFSSDLLQ